MPTTLPNDLAAYWEARYPGENADTFLTGFTLGILMATRHSLWASRYLYDDARLAEDSIVDSSSVQEIDTIAHLLAPPLC